MLKTNPLKNETRDIKRRVFKFCFKGLFTWKRTINPIPALARIALKKAPSGNVPSANNCAETTEVAQFGIKPNSVLKNGPYTA